MELGEPAIRRLFEAMAATIAAHADELTRLDQAIGDGDHGTNMQRGFDAVRAELDRLAAKPLPEALTALGTTLVMKVGGASGPLYGTLFMQLGRALPASFGLAELAAAGDAALGAVKARGKSDTGSKTMLDVLAPVLAALREAAAGDPAGLGERLSDVAGAAAEATIPMRALRGRASFLGERSIGHMDPGARSSALLVAAACQALAPAGAGGSAP
jgi:dihydroxyacetone kinase-like protein